MNVDTQTAPVLILGAGINGCCVARELILNNVPVVLVDSADIATGATAKSSRLIHGGVRYLEYADFGLVAESLEERERLLKLAPQFVKPLRLYIPVRHRTGGLVVSAFRFLGLNRLPGANAFARRFSPSPERGLATVRFGLWLYDRIARSSLLPVHGVCRVGESGPPVDPSRYGWLCSYSDAQMVFPERFVIALLKDAERHARAHRVEFRVLTWHAARRNQERIQLFPTLGTPAESAPPVLDLRPSCIINATGAWGDLTLEQLHVKSPRLFGGTKGSHIITRHAGLRSALGDDGIYAETADGRLVFLLPFDDAVLIGTTDLRFTGSPGAVTASSQEIAYLVETANLIFSDFELTTSDVVAHYCGVRPLPAREEGTTGAIPRGHSIHSAVADGIPLHTLIGGKLTTCRAFGEEVADLVLSQLGQRRTAHTRDRALPGAEEYPLNPQQWMQTLADETGHPSGTVNFLFRRMGTAARPLLRTVPPSPELPMLPLSAPLVREITRIEWVSTLADLVERRLMLVYSGSLSASSLAALQEATRLPALPHEQSPPGLAHYQEFLQSKYGIRP